jgi:hypothetical protein
VLFYLFFGLRTQAFDLALAVTETAQYAGPDI